MDVSAALPLPLSTPVVSIELIRASRFSGLCKFSVNVEIPETEPGGGRPRAVKFDTEEDLLRPETPVVEKLCD